VNAFFRTLPAVVAAVLIAGCSDGDDAQKTQLNGTAATGAPVAGGNVSVTCGTATATATTNANGTWSVNVASPTFPCLVAVTGGSLPAGTQLYGYATSEANVNVTPLTTLIGAYANAAANGGPLTQALLDAATAKLVTQLKDAGFTNVPANPLTASFTPRNGDPYDDLLEALMTSLDQQGTTLNQVANEIAKDGTPDSGTLVTPSVAAFDSIPDPLPPNMPSYGPEAYQLTSLGDRITLAAGTSRHLREVTIAMSSWACQGGGWNTADCVTAANATFTHPITLRIYDDSTNTLLATRTQTFTMPYRPSADASCAGGRWKAPNGTCYNGFAFKVVFDLRSLDVTLPDNVRYDLTYNTRTQGPQPLGVTGPYDSLNMGVYDPATASPSAGTDPDPGYLIWNGAPFKEDPNQGYGLMAQFHVGP